MKRLSKLLLFILIMGIMFMNAGCSSFSGEEGTEIIDASEAVNLLSQEDVVIVDAQNTRGYSQNHVKNSVNIARADIVINEPVPNMLGSKEQIEEVMSKNGISNDSTIIVYDNNNNMDSARLWWTLKVYGHEDVKVVSGGLKALGKAGAEFTKELPNISPVEYTAKEKDTSMIATIDDVKEQVNNPKENVMLIDTRSQEEYDAGTIPGSVLMNYIDNNYNDGTFKSVSDIQTMYLDEGLIPEDTAIMYCKTSIRGAQTYLALYNAGYTNLKLYDGAWVQWSKDSSLPVQRPENTKVEVNQQDMS
ncbi:sulfurtransferase [Clostridiisalibacter paucivorans]|uniref:sulfurtransferase n=1 Tax=Clostridiisalibacter paucivorans TaxID=408753 RepID=UPI0004793C2B|nr:sulfurtransferase [Clostridiisalibacter paucivorans]